jgi:branched-chain amino acid transport system ATP-binding protein
VVNPALAVSGLAVRYGAVQVCQGIDLELGSTTVGVLAGTNGAGKSSILRALAGVTPAAGSVRLFGEELAGLPAEARARRGLVLAAGGGGTFRSLTVEESVALGTWTRRAPARAAAVEEAFALFPTLASRRGQRCATLSAGEQHLVVLARAVVAHARVLLVDELTFGLAGALAEEAGAAMAGRTPVLLVDQAIGPVLGRATWAWFLERGEIRFSGPPAALAARRDLLQPVWLW